jgi:hypothetical protein
VRYGTRLDQSEQSLHTLFRARPELALEKRMMSENKRGKPGYMRGRDGRAVDRGVATTGNG